MGQSVQKCYDRHADWRKVRIAHWMVFMPAKTQGRDVCSSISWTVSSTERYTNQWRSQSNWQAQRPIYFCLSIEWLPVNQSWEIIIGKDLESIKLSTRRLLRTLGQLFAWLERPLCYRPVTTCLRAFSTEVWLWVVCLMFDFWYY